MTSSTSRRSAKVIRKPEPEPDTSGIPIETTEPESEPISRTSTTWTIIQPGSKPQTVTVPGNGRFTLGGTRGSELRIYANKSDKDYVFASRDGITVARDDVEIGVVVSAPITKAATAYEMTEYDISVLAEKIVAATEKEDEPSAW